MKTAATATTVLLFLTGLAEAQIEAPSAYERSIETPGDGGGMIDEADAATAQGEAIEAGEPVPGVSTDERGRIEEIVVTARRREEMLEDTPVAVTALSAANLRQSNITQIDQIEQMVPNMSFRNGATGQTVSIQIRGVGTSTTGAAFDPGVGLYIDGVFLPRAQSSIFDVVDIAQVEVLRGPQGTLFGKNTVGGAVNVTTVKPKEDFEGFVFLRPGNFGALNTRMMLNVPVNIGWFEDKLFVRAALASENRSGYSYNEFRDEYWDNQNGLTFLGSLRFLPIEDLTIDVSGTWWRNHSRGGNGQCVFVQETGLGSLTPGFWDACRESEPLFFQSDVATIADFANWGTWGTIRYDIGDAGWFEQLAVKSITSWRQQSNRSRQDHDATRFSVLQVSQAGYGPLDGAPGASQQIQQEMQLEGGAWEDRISFITGLFLFWETAERHNTTFAGGVPNAGNNNSSIDNWTWALFAQATADVTDWMSLTAGLRYTEDKKGADQLNFDALDPGSPPTRDASGRRVFTAWTPMASIAFLAPDSILEPAYLDHLMGYFTYSRGFKGGGFNAVINPSAEGNMLEPYEPETLNSFELGAKTIAFDQRLTFNLALFRSDYQDIQQTVLEANEDDEGNITVLRLTRNAAEATIQGVEAEVRVVPVEGLQIMGSLGYMDPRYDSFPDAVSGITNQQIDRAGETLVNSPALQTFIGVQYSFPVEIGQSEWMTGWLTPRVEWAYRDHYHIAGPEVWPLVQPGYNLINARLSYEFLDDRAQVALWGRNLTDELYFNSGVPLATTFGTTRRIFSAPRTWGAELSYAF